MDFGGRGSGDDRSGSVFANRQRRLAQSMADSARGPNGDVRHGYANETAGFCGCRAIASWGIGRSTWPFHGNALDGFCIDQAVSFQARDSVGYNTDRLVFERVGVERYGVFGALKSGAFGDNHRCDHNLCHRVYAIVDEASCRDARRGAARCDDAGSLKSY